MRKLLGVQLRHWLSYCCWLWVGLPFDACRGADAAVAEVPNTPARRRRGLRLLRAVSSLATGAALLTGDKERFVPLENTPLYAHKKIADEYLDYEYQVQDSNVVENLAKGEDAFHLYVGPQDGTPLGPDKRKISLSEEPTQGEDGLSSAKPKSAQTAGGEPATAGVSEELAVEGLEGTSSAVGQTSDGAPATLASSKLGKTQGAGGSLAEPPGSGPALPGPEDKKVQAPTTAPHKKLGLFSALAVGVAVASIFCWQQFKARSAKKQKSSKKGGRKV